MRRSLAVWLAAGAMAVGLAAPIGSARAADEVGGFPVDQLIDAGFIEDTRAWLEVPVVRLTITAQNERRGEISAQEIEARDAAWVKERESDHQPFVASVLSNPLSTYLTRIQARSLGLIAEIIVVDNLGLNAGQSAVTGDYWQGDEAKFKKTFAVGANAVFLDEAEFKDDTATWRAQLNMTVHSEDGAPIGAATVEVNLTELARRRAALTN